MRRQGGSRLLLATLVLLLSLSCLAHAGQIEDIKKRARNYRSLYTEKDVQEITDHAYNLAGLLDAAVPGSGLTQIIDMASSSTDVLGGLKAVTDVTTPEGEPAGNALQHLFTILAGPNSTSSDDSSSPPISKDSSSSEDNKDTRGPHLHDIPLYPAPFVCDHGTFNALVAPVKATINLLAFSIPPVVYDSPPDTFACMTTGDWDREAGLHIATNVVIGLAMVADIACNAAKDEPIPPICVNAAPAICLAKSIIGAIKVAVDLWNVMVNAQDGMIADAYFEATYINDIVVYNAVQCLNATEPRKYHGCNGADDNCNLEADDCNEDVFAPDMTLDLTLLSTAPYFTNTAEAAAFASTVVQAIDDCSPPEQVVISGPVLTGSCENVNASFTATDYCGNINYVTVPLKLDTTPPVISDCQVAFPTLTGEVGLDIFLNVGFTFVATDSCDGTPKVAIEVWVDELPYDTLLVPEAIVSYDYYGGYHGVLVRATHNRGSGGRVYTIRATATDTAGLSDSCSATVSVPAAGFGAPVNNGPIYRIV